MSIYILWSIHENNNVVYSTIFDIGLHFIKIQVLHQKQQTNEIHLLLEKRELNEHLSPSSWSTSNNLIISVLNLYDKSCLNIVYISSAFAIGKLLLCPKVHSFVRLLTTHQLLQLEDTFFATTSQLAACVCLKFLAQCRYES